MAQTITKSAKDMVKAAISAVPAISAEEALALKDSPDHVFVDLRDGTEQAKNWRHCRGGCVVTRDDGIPHRPGKSGPQVGVQSR